MIVFLLSGTCFVVYCCKSGLFCNFRKLKSYKISHPLRNEPQIGNFCLFWHFFAFWNFKHVIHIKSRIRLLIVQYTTLLQNKGTLKKHRFLNKWISYHFHFGSKSHNTKKTRFLIRAIFASIFENWHLLFFEFLYLIIYQLYEIFFVWNI